MTQTVYTDSVSIQGSQDTPQLQVKGFSTQTQPLQNWLDNTNTVQAQVTGDGRLQVGNNLGGTAPADALIQVNENITLPSSAPLSAWHTLGQITSSVSALTTPITWVLHELKLLGTAGVSTLQVAMRSVLTHNNSGTSTSAELRAADVQTVNQGGGPANYVGQATGLRGTASNAATGYLTKAVGVEAAITNDAGGNLTQASAFEVVPPSAVSGIGTLYGLKVPTLATGPVNYAIYTGANKVHLGGDLEQAGSNIGFRNVTPVAMPSSTADIKQALQDVGLLNATDAATPLNLNGGALTATGLASLGPITVSGSGGAIALNISSAVAVTNQSGVVLEPTITTNVSNIALVEARGTIKASAGNLAYYGIETIPTIDATAANTPVTQVAALYARVDQAGAYTGTVGSAIGVYIGTPIKVAGGAISNAYGLYIEDQTPAGSTGQYAIYTNAGKVRIGGEFRHDGATLGFYNTTPVGRQPYLGVSGTLSRAAFNTGTITAATVAQVLGALITDLKAVGLLG